MNLKNMLTGEVIHSGDFESMKELVLDAINKGADLRGANLECANLRGANLECANLVDANLGCANLRGANLVDANLVDANLRGANLVDANLECANLGCANLRGANLECANLRGANLVDANLVDANLRGANLVDANLVDANLRGANLVDANLECANLMNCAGNRNEIRSMFISDVYPIVYTPEYLQIGCELHKISDWWSFDDDRIKEMDGKEALDFWFENKEFIKMAIEKYPATPTN